MFTKKEIDQLNSPNISSTTKTLQYKLTDLQTENQTHILSNFTALSNIQIDLFSSKEKLKVLLETIDNLHNTFIKENTEIISNLNNLTETENTKLKVGNILKIFKKLHRIYQIISKYDSNRKNNEENKKKENVYKDVARILDLQNRIKLFKEFSFHLKLQNEVSEMRAHLLLRMKNKSDLFLKTVQQNYSELGFLVSEQILKKSENNLKNETVIFDDRFTFRTKIDFSIVLNSIYVFKQLDEDYFLFFNTKREKLTKILNITNQNSTNDLIGFLLVEFYLFSKRMEFDLLEVYVDLLVSHLRNITKSSLNNLEKIDLLYKVQIFVKKFYQRYLIKINDQILQYMFSDLEKHSLSNIKQVEQFSKLKSIINKFDIRELNEVFNKKLETSVLALKKSNHTLNISIKGMQPSLQSKLERIDQNLRRQDLDIFLRELKNINFMNYKQFISKISDREIRDLVIKETGKLFRTRIKNGENKKKVEKDFAICVAVCRELKFDEGLLGAKE